MRKCISCRQQKLLDKFPKGHGCRDGRRPECKECVKITRKSPAMRFKISLQASAQKSRRLGYIGCTATEQEIRNAFTSFCEICGVREDECFQNLHMDHCHETGDFRGWLCYRCNNLLGRAADSTSVLRIAAEYLESKKVISE